MCFTNRTSRSGIASVMTTPGKQFRYHIMNKDDGGYWAAGSDDGISTTELRQPGKPSFEYGSDVGNFMFDPLADMFRGYVKVAVNVSGKRRRAVAYTESRDLLQWPPEPELVLAPDHLDDFDGSWVTNFYGMPVVQVADVFIGLLWVFRATDPDGYWFGKVHTELTVSRDARKWRRADFIPGTGRPPLIELGSASRDDWDWGQIYTANSAPVVSADGRTCRFWYGGADSLHDKLLNMSASIGIAEIRTHGFASWTTSDGVAANFTTVVQPPADIGAQNDSARLRVNFQGHIAVGLAVNGHVLARASLSGDEIAGVLPWTLPTTSHYTLEFSVAPNSHIYSFAVW